MVKRIGGFVLVALVGALVGVALSYYPSLRDDLRFLHAARLMSEYQAMQQQQQTQQQKQDSNVVVASPGTIVPGAPKDHELSKDEKKK